MHCNWCIAASLFFFAAHCFIRLGTQVLSHDGTSVVCVSDLATTTQHQTPYLPSFLLCSTYVLRSFHERSILRDPFSEIYSQRSCGPQPAPAGVLHGSAGRPMWIISYFHTESVILTTQLIILFNTGAHDGHRAAGGASRRAERDGQLWCVHVSHSRPHSMIVGLYFRSKTAVFLSA